jgi:hypothetical protein
LVQVNRAQLRALVKLASVQDIETLVLTNAAGDALIVTMTDLEDASLTLTLDEWGQGRLHTNATSA